MNLLIETLRPFHRPADVLGAEPLDRSAIQAALAGLERRLQTTYWIRVGLIGAVFLVETGIVIACRNQPPILAAVAGAIGVTIAGAVTAMAAVSRDMAETGLTLILAGQLDAESMTRIVGALVSRSRHGDAGEHRRQSRPRSLANASGA